MANTPVYTNVPNVAAVLVNTANTNTDGTSGVRATIFTAATSSTGTGARIDSIQIKGITAEGATQAADTVRLWINNGTSSFIWREVIIPVGSGVVSTTVPNVEVTVSVGIDLPAGYSMQASTHAGGATGSYHVTGFGANY